MGDVIGWLGVDGWGIVIVLAFIAFDILTGFVKGAVRGSLSSTVMRRGLYHKLAFVLALAFAALVQFATLHFDLPRELGAVFPAICLYLILTEIVSILENLVEINPELANNRFLGLFGRKEGDDDGGN